MEGTHVGKRYYFTPINGVTNDQPLCFLLELGKTHDTSSNEHTQGGVNILLDCGWNDSFELDDLNILRDVVRTRSIDCILLSGPALQQVGALPYLVKELRVKCPILATQPTKAMGHICLYDVHNYRAERIGKMPFTCESIDEVFGKIQTLKFHEMHRFDLGPQQGDAGDLIVIPHPAGHTVGTCVWQLIKDSDDIIYAPNFNHRRERHLPAADFQMFAKATIGILSTETALEQPPPRDRDKIILDKVMHTLRRDGNVLIPCDLSGRVLEIMLILEAHWNEVWGDLGSPYSLVFYSEFGECMAAMAEQALEYMSETVRKAFEEKGYNPMSFLTRGIIKFCRSREELDELTHPMVVFATPFSMNFGYSLDLLLEWGENPQNTILLFAKTTDPSSIVSRVFEHATSAPPGDPLLIEVQREVPLTKEELQEWRAKEQERLEMEAMQEEARAQRRNITEIVDEEHEAGMESDEDSDEDGRPAAKDARELRKAHPIRTTPGLFLPSSIAYHSKHLMFPCIEPDHPDTDEFGEALDAALLKQLKQSDDIESAVLRELEMEEEEQRRKEQEQQRAKTVDELEPPKKYTQQLVNMGLRCTIMQHVHEGLIDGPSLKHILQSYCGNVQQLIFVHGAMNSTAELVQFCKGSEINSKIHAPGLGQREDITSATSMYRVKVKDELVHSLSFTDIGDYKVAWAEGQIAVEKPLDDAVPQNKRRREQPMLVLEPSEKPLRKVPRSLYIGDVLLRDYTIGLKRENWKAAFHKGVLLVNDKVVYRKATKSQMAMSGVWSPEWVKLRRHLSKNFTVL